MNRSSVAAGTLLALLLSAPAVAQRSDPARTALLQTDTDWSRVAAAGKDLDRILSYWSDDAVVYPPGVAAVSGKAAIRNYVGASLKTPFFSISWKPAQAVVSSSGDLGYTMGSNEITFADAKGKVTRAQGRYLTVWKRTDRGEWKCVVDFWNDSPFAPPPVLKASPARKTQAKPSPRPTRNK